MEGIALTHPLSHICATGRVTLCVTGPRSSPSRHLFADIARDEPSARPRMDGRCSADVMDFDVPACERHRSEK
eukprot:7294398-Prymnesium_polylepis.1